MSLSSKMLKRIRSIMEENHISAYKLSLESGVSGACLNNWLNNNDCNPTINNIEKVASALGVSVVDLLDETEIDSSVDSYDFSRLFNVFEKLNSEHRAVIYELSKVLLTRERVEKSNDKNKEDKSNSNWF